MGSTRSASNTPMIWAQVVSDIYKMVEDDEDVWSIREIVLGNEDLLDKIRTREFIDNA